MCLNRLRICLLSSANGATQNNTTEGVSFVKLLDSLLDLLTDFTSEHVDKSCIDVKLLSKQIKSQVDLLLGQTLSFANVALQQDKRALSALCQRVFGYI